MFSSNFSLLFCLFSSLFKYINTTISIIIAIANITNIELTEDIIKDIELEMKNIVNKDYEIIKKSFTKEESEEFYAKNRSLRGMLQKDVKNEVKLYFCDRIF